MLTTKTALSYIQPDWPASSNIRAYQTTRQGGFARGPYSTFSLGGATSFEARESIKVNQKKLVTNLEIEDHPPLWLKQVHGNQVVNREADDSMNPEADACFSTKPQIVCAVQTADCLPILLCDRGATIVAAIHAGWKGVLAGVIEVTIAALPVNSKELMAWLGPAIGPCHFEVGADVYDLFVAYDEESATCFTPHKTGKWLADLCQLARQRLSNCGIENVYGGHYCTYSQKDLFFSYRRDGGQTGRMASLIWLE